VWKRTDGVWTPITETIGTLSCGSLAMDPANHDVLYLGLGDPSTRGEARTILGEHRLRREHAAASPSP
jgi:hypothetical protein